MSAEWWADEQRVRSGILRLIELAADDDEELQYIGIATMEGEFVGEEDWLAWIEEHAAQSSRFRRALGNLYIWGDIPDEAAERIEAAAGVRLKRPPWRTSYS